MRNRAILSIVAFFFVRPLFADDTFTLTTVSMNPANPGDVVVGYTGKLPSPSSSYDQGLDWKVQWQGTKTGAVTTLTVATVDVDAQDNVFTLHLSAGALPAPANFRTTFWTVLLMSDQIPFATITLTPTSHTQTKSCTDTTKSQPYLCPVTPPATPDLSFSGTYTAGGGTNPLYQFEVKGGLIFPRIPKIPSDPAINTQIEINQNPKPPITRTRFDPDSITAGLAFTNWIDFDTKGQTPKGPLLGMRFQEQAIGGEFNRTDPSSNLIWSAIADFDFKPLRKATKAGEDAVPSPYFTFYPFLGMEAGRNLNRPRIVEMIPVDLSAYKGIVRGYMGADAKFAVASADRKSDVFSIASTYRVRIPTINEPFLATEHQATTFAMTTKARHWTETDIAYTPPNWKYVSLTATYQYGELPPFFEFVNHKFTLGFKLQAVQGTKPLNSKLVQ